MSAPAIIGVVGLGAMGLGIAQVFASAGFKVIATDAHTPARDSAKTRMADALLSRVSAGKLSVEMHDMTLANLEVVSDLNGLAACDLIIEAIVEKLEAKQALFASLEKIVKDTAILATNTSSIPVSAIAATARNPGRILALHFFNPPTAMKLVELAPQEMTLKSVIKYVTQLVEKTGKTAIQCLDRPGFIVNRCARPFYGEALALLQEGRGALDIDAAMLSAGYRLGPFALIDLIGADINLAATLGMYAAMENHARYHPFQALRDQVASGHLGRKSGQGFVHPSPPGTAPPDAAAIALRIESTLINEAHWLLAEGGTTRDGIDTAMKLGLNFPRGPFEALHLHGRDKVRATLAALEAAAPPALKPRYVPGPGLA